MTVAATITQIITGWLRSIGSHPCEVQVINRAPAGAPIRDARWCVCLTFGDWDGQQWSPAFLVEKDTKADADRCASRYRRQIGKLVTQWQAT